MKNICKLLIALGLTALSSVVIFAQTDDSNKAELVQKMNERNNYTYGKIVENFLDFRMPSGCWEKLSSDESSPNGLDQVSRWAKAIMEHAKLMGYGDLEEVGGLEIGAEALKRNRSKIDAIIAKMNGKFLFTFQVDGKTCDAEQFRLLMGYAGIIRSFIGNSSESTRGMNRGWKPRAGKMDIALVFSPKAKNVTVAISADGAKFIVNSPSENEPEEWDRKIEEGLVKGGTNKN